MPAVTASLIRPVTISHGTAVDEWCACVGNPHEAGKPRTLLDRQDTPYLYHEWLQNTVAHIPLFIH